MPELVNDDFHVDVCYPFPNVKCSASPLIIIHLVVGVVCLLIIFYFQAKFTRLYFEYRNDIYKRIILYYAFLTYISSFDIISPVIPSDVYANKCVYYCMIHMDILYYCVYILLCEHAAEALKLTTESGSKCLDYFLIAFKFFLIAFSLFILYSLSFAKLSSVQEGIKSNDTIVKVAVFMKIAFYDGVNKFIFVMTMFILTITYIQNENIRRIIGEKNAMSINVIIFFICFFVFFSVIEDNIVETREVQNILVTNIGISKYVTFYSIMRIVIYFIPKIVLAIMMRFLALSDSDIDEEASDDKNNSLYNFVNKALLD